VRAADAVKVTRASGNARWRGFPARLLPNDRDVRWRGRRREGGPVEGSIRRVNLRGGNEDKAHVREHRVMFLNRFSKIVPRSNSPILIARLHCLEYQNCSTAPSTFQHQLLCNRLVYDTSQYLQSYR